MKVRSIITAKTGEKTDDLVTRGTNLGIKLIADANTGVSAQGTVVADQVLILKNMRVDEQDLRDALKTKVQDIKDQKIVVTGAMNTAAKLVALAYVLAYAFWMSFGFIVSKVAGKGHVPAKPTDCKSIQGAAKGTAQLNRKADTGSWCKILETNGDPTILTNYAPSTPNLMKTSKIIVTPKNLKVQTWFILVPVNGIGDGTPSDPFGGTFV
jgi:hypothetical protein